MIMQYKKGFITAWFEQKTLLCRTGRRCLSVLRKTLICDRILCFIICLFRWSWAILGISILFASLIANLAIFNTKWYAAYRAVSSVISIYTHSATEMKCTFQNFTYEWFHNESRKLYKSLITSGVCSLGSTLRRDTDVASPISCNTAEAITNISLHYTLGISPMTKDQDYTLFRQLIDTLDQQCP